MSLKPTKKSDLNKAWLKGRDARTKTVRVHPEYHLIYTEGTDTEPYYFEAIKTEINKRYRDRISLEIEGAGDNTVSLFYKAKNKADKSLNDYKHIWVIYDTDDFPADHINQTAELCASNSTDEIQYHAIWSNQCIELWFLLHFGYFQSDIHRSDYWPKLTKHLTTLGLGAYSKDRTDMYNVLKPMMRNAITNAKKLEDRNKGKTPADSAPGTKIYQMIELLMPYLEV